MTTEAKSKPICKIIWSAKPTEFSHAIIHKNPHFFDSYLLVRNNGKIEKINYTPI